MPRNPPRRALIQASTRSIASGNCRRSSMPWRCSVGAIHAPNPNEQSEERDDDQRRADSARQPPARQHVDPGRDGEAEQNPEECGEEERVREPDELREEVHPDDERRGAKNVGAAKSRRARSSRAIGSGRTLDSPAWVVASSSGCVMRLAPGKVNAG